MRKRRVFPKKKKKDKLIFWTITTFFVVNVTHLKSYNVQKWKSPLAPLLGETDMCAHWLCCTKFNYKQLLFEPFLDVMHIFGSVEPKVNPISHFCTLNDLNILIFWAPSFTPGRDRHVCPLTFLFEIQLRITFIWNFFWCDAYFWQPCVPKWIQFPISVHYKSVQETKNEN